MHILILSDLYPPYYKGGHELMCKFMADGLTRMGHKVDVLTSRYGCEKKESGGGVYRFLHYIDIEGDRMGRRIAQMKGIPAGLFNYRITDRIVCQHRPDIVYAGQTTNISMYPLKAIGRHRIPIVHHVANRFIVDLVTICEFEKNGLKKKFRRFFYGFHSRKDPEFQNIITVSGMLKKKYSEVGFPEDRISIVPPVGIPLKNLKRIEKKPVTPGEGALKLLYVGRLVPEKGVHVAIEATRIVKCQMGVEHLILDIYGDGDAGYIEHLRTTIKEHGLEDTVKVKGPLPHEDMIEAYGRYRILLVPSIWEEPFGIIILEAFSRGLPVIATRTGGIPEIIEDGKTGLLVPPNDPLEMAKSVKRLSDNPALEKEIISNGIEAIRRHYSDEIVLKKMESHLRAKIRD